MTFFSILYNIIIGPLQLFFEVVYNSMYRIIGRPGFCIVFLSLAMNLLVLPLYKKADEMQARERDIEAGLQKGINHIKKTFKGDDRMMMLQTYYRQNNYSPMDALKGSVSLLLEIPFFIAAYNFLSHLTLIQGVSFGPLRDLGAPDGLLVVGPVAINVLPVLMTLINIISSAIYTKGFPAKTKIQLYVMALIFLVFLYKSPSGLVFYWTLNNLFSLVKNVFYKLKNAAFIIKCILGVTGVAAIIAAITRVGNKYIEVYIVLAIAGVVMIIPLAMTILGKRGVKLPTIKAKPCPKVFTAVCILLSVLVGILIPSSVIKASPLEFIDIRHYSHPVWFIISTFALAAGFFIVWIRVFYSLADDKIKVVFERIMESYSVIAIVDYMFFGRKLGLINSSLIYGDVLSFDKKEKIINLLVMAAVIAATIVIVHFVKDKIAPVYFIAALALFAMCIVNITSINKAVDDYNKRTVNEDNPPIVLSKEGQNVVFIMLDRAQGLYLPYLMKEKPELREIYDGFTYYDNVVSFAGFTNMATPALYGGYEYTPYEINLRDDETLRDEHNEALKLMPYLFAENDFDVVLYNPSYADYKMIPDVSIFDDNDRIKAGLTYGKYISEEHSTQLAENNRRNFFCYSLMKTLPVVAQPILYEGGKYHSLAGYRENVYAGQAATDRSHASGLLGTEMDYFHTVEQMPNITEIRDDSSNNYFFYVCELTHDVIMVDEKTYQPSMFIDNSEYDAAHEDRFTLDGVTLDMSSPKQMGHYQSNMMALLEIGKWIEYLKENGVYDNTRIIIAADHGRDALHNSDFILGEENLANSDMKFEEGNHPYNSEYNLYDTTLYFPLLMVKDFNASGFSVCSDFMTNADVPAIAMEGLIENPVNPFTGNPVSNDYKEDHDIYILASDFYYVDNDEWTTFDRGDWLTVRDDRSILDNWRILQQLSISPLEKKQ